MNAVRELCPSKINLYLDVTGVRDDGFHTVRTVMHSVSLFDEVVVAKQSGEGSVRLTVRGESYLPTDDRNLCVKAAKAYLDALGIRDGVSIVLTKNIPVAAGLAGGSSDAAGVLRALNKLYKRPLTVKLLSMLAAQLGSDVPYCLVGGSAICSGRGEEMAKIPDISLHTVVAISDEHVSTPEAYSLLDKRFSGFTEHKEHGGDLSRKWLDSGCADEFSADMLFNIFEEVILPICPKAARIKERMTALGARSAMMSGSGPSVFGIFDTEDMARRAADALLAEGYFARYARSV